MEGRLARVTPQAWRLVVPVGGALTAGVFAQEVRGSVRMLGSVCVCVCVFESRRLFQRSGWIC